MMTLHHVIIITIVIIGACSEFCCRDGECIAQSKVCDGYNDCGDYYDEDDCEDDCRDKLCPSGRCISDHVVCDGKQDCPDGSDERGCGSSDEGLPTGAIVGIVAGCVLVFFILLTRCVWYYYKHGRRFMCCVLWDSHYCSRCRDDESNCSDDTTPEEIDPTLFQPPPSYEDVQARTHSSRNNISDEDDKHLPHYSEVLSGVYAVVSTPAGGVINQEGMGHPSGADVPPPRYQSIHRQDGTSRQRTSRPPTYQANKDNGDSEVIPTTHNNAGFTDACVFHIENVNQRASYPVSSNENNQSIHGSLTRLNTYHGTGFQEGASHQRTATGNSDEIDSNNERDMDVDQSAKQVMHSPAIVPTDHSSPTDQPESDHPFPTDQRGRASADRPSSVSPTNQLNYPVTYHDNLGFMDSRENLSVEYNDPHQTLDIIPAESSSPSSIAETASHISSTDSETRSSRHVPELTLQPSHLQLDGNSTAETSSPSSIAETASHMSTAESETGSSRHVPELTMQASHFQLDGNSTAETSSPSSIAETASHIPTAESETGKSSHVPELTLQVSHLQLDGDSDSDMYVRRRVSLDNSHHTEV